MGASCRWMAGLVAGLLLSAATSLWAGSEERWFGYQSAELEIGPDGRLIEARLVDSTLGKTMQQAIIERLGRIEFEPAKVNGSPVASASRATLQLAVLPRDDGLEVVLDDVYLTAGLRRTVAPRYPSRDLSAGRTGEVRLQIEFGPDGKPTAVEALTTDRDFTRMAAAARKVAWDWEFEPQLVDGKPVAGSAVVPVRFTLKGGPSGDLQRGRLNFPDGGYLTVFANVVAQERLTRAAVGVRSFDAARAPIGGPQPMR